MTLAAHTVVGTALASLLPNHPLLGFGAAFVSHFALDSLPHWDYTLAALTEDPKEPLNADIAFDSRFAKDLIRIGLDAALGLLLAALFLLALGMHLYPTLLAGALGGIVPDALQLVYVKFRHEPFRSLQRFHMAIQAGRKLKVKPVIGLFLQAILALAVCLVVFPFTR